MNLPLQAPPVNRYVTHSRYDAAQVTASNIGCTICRTLCDQLGGIPKQLCLLACDKTVC